MGLWRAIINLFRPRPAYERLVSEWIDYEHAWRKQYARARSTEERRRLVDLLQEQRSSFYSRKLEIEQTPTQEYKPVLLRVPELEPVHTRTVADILREKANDKSHGTAG